ncbi:hypothetical protein C499_01725 [Halogeometricum borinquense DSM 11551]|uniref:Uncharacterized protein n=2 Tax=Halogeometricum borinquense TaxID=60847 RepID=E4NP04_HALBP|nr:hypothetical protein [Halogeometricum borinquense]ADQ66435.1 hypothetical protein Hbor_08390 [Halogeometricum borinquense DSM 11551]ELY31155.1 hypothetical protein C499_01725 [Halogeometricum borinquense DSM 11551]RYJ15168.1 hypothetical protein ELS19_15260 [Halogeometricum borinquense]
MSDIFRVYGSIFVLLLGAVLGSLTVALFISPTWVIDTLGLAGFGVYIVVILALPVFSFKYDLVGNAKEAFR